MCAGIACLCVNDALAKTLTVNYSPLQIQFLRNAIALPFTILIAWKMGGGAALRSHRPVAHFMRGALWIGATYLLLLYMTGTGAVLSLFLVPFVWTPVRPEDLYLFAAVAIFGSAGMTMMTQAFRLAPAVVVAPLDYTAIIWATALGWLFWNEIPDALTFVGAAVIIASGVFIIWREHRVGR